MIADALLVRGIRVEHILSARRRQLHKLTPFAYVRGFEITYLAANGKIESGSVKGEMP